MSLADRPYMREQGSRQRATRLDRPPADAIEMVRTPFRQAHGDQQAAGQGFRDQPALRKSLRCPLGLLAASAGLLTLGWAVACGLIGASLQTTSGTFVPPALERSHGPR